MRRLILAAALALTLPAAAIAQSAGHVNATSGALAGRSPHHAFRPASAAAGCPAAMHTLPSGKLPVYGATTLARPGCDDTARIADTGASTVRAAR